MFKKLKGAPFSQGIPLNILIFFTILSFLFLFPFLTERNQGPTLAEMPENYLEIQRGYSKGKFLTFHENTLSPYHTFWTKEEPVMAIITEEKEREVIEVVQTTITAYSSTVDQTDSTPYITASGSRVRDGVAAANFLPFGTEIRIPVYFGDKIFIIEDRMNARFSNRVDIWFPSRQQAIDFGITETKIEVLEEK